LRPKVEGGEVFICDLRVTHLRLIFNLKHFFICDLRVSPIHYSDHAYCFIAGPTLA
jgi:hypothetical protein